MNRPLKKLGSEWDILANWKASEFFHEYQFHHEGDITPVVSLDWWRWYLRHYGGVLAPAHVCSPYAHRQALEIAHELCAVADEVGEHESNPFHPVMAMVGLAFAVCRALKEGREIRSLAFIAENLIYRARTGDDGWAYAVPHRIEHEDFDRASKLAWKWVDQMMNLKCQLEFDSRALMSTYGIEWLHQLTRRYGLDAVAAGIRDFIRANSANVWSWEQFEQAVRAAKSARRKGGRHA